ncbi:hypothetical protein KX729_07115 [Rhizobium sp. XQZ8]|uniref:hypothetical protein n=1 Tax=Rhizobium populisoli TaxID=2859785 RepID=UPI001CA4F719|nr:hypothetical protein [Rhizobium populisoli]MBW6421209.1 hypothetical protein [Rhizobium populisoli]
MASYLFVLVLMLGCGLANLLGPNREFRSGGIKSALNEANRGLNTVVSKRDAQRAEIRILVLLVWLVATIALLIWLLGGFRGYFG